MPDFKDLFNEEAHEQLGIAEESILAYEKNPSLEHIEVAFRALHTFKGAAHIFSLTNIGNFAHLVESILDGLRQNTLKNTPELLSKLLLYMDHLRKIMDDPQLKNKKLNKNDQTFSQEIINLTKGISIEEEKEKAVEEIQVKVESTGNAQTWFLVVTPKIELLENSPHPALFMIEDIKAWGPHVANVVLKTGTTNQISHWDIYISCKKEKEDFDVLFMFIDDEIDANIQLLAPDNLFNKPGFIEVLNDISELDTIDKLENITTFIEHSKTTDALTNTNSSENLNSKSSSIRVATDKIDILLNLVSELVTAQASLGLFAQNSSSVQLKDLAEVMDRNIRQLRDIAFEVTLIPIDNMMGKFKRFVRDVSISIGKDVDFIVKGESTELDKAFIEKLSDPIMHILRNCIDHGIEMPDVRKEKGKPKTGTVKFEAYYSGAFVNIDIIDDGKGLDTNAILAKAIQKGIIDENQKLSKTEIYNLIFQPGFSTAQMVSDLSGRGVGMDVVKKNITALRGTIDVSSEQDVGTKISVKVPLTLSIIDGLLFRVKETFFVVPLLSVYKCYGIQQKSFDRLNKVLVLDEEQIPYIFIREDFFDDLNNNGINTFHVISLNIRDKKIAIVVDEIMGEYQAVLKPVGAHYKHQEYISGASILGDGTVALVLDINKLMENKLKELHHEFK